MPEVTAVCCIAVAGVRAAGTPSGCARGTGSLCGGRAVLAAGGKLTGHP